MKHFSMHTRLLLIAVITLLSVTACQKETNDQPGPVQPQTTGLGANDRTEDGLVLGVTVASGGSQVVVMNDMTAAVAGAFVPFTMVANNPVNLTNLKGICRVADRYYITTGFNMLASISNTLFTLNLATNQATKVSTSPIAIGAVSDIDYNPKTNQIYGLADNTNNFVTISDLGTGFINYAAVAIGSVGAGYTLHGLTMVGNANGAGGLKVIAAGRNAGATVRLYELTVGGAVTASGVGDLTTAADLQDGHCGLGYDLDVPHLLINRNLTGTNGAGLNDIAWPLPGGGNLTSVWGGTGYDFEDLSTYVGKYW